MRLKKAKTMRQSDKYKYPVMVTQSPHKVAISNR